MRKVYRLRRRRSRAIGAHGREGRSHVLTTRQGEREFPRCQQNIDGLPQSQALCSFHASQAETRHMTATISSVSSIVSPMPIKTLRISVAATMKPEFTILLAAIVRAVCDLATVVVRKA